MTFYVTTRENGDIATRHIKGLGQLPSNAIQLDETDWIRLTQENDGIWSWDGQTLVKRPHPVVEGAIEDLIARTRYAHEIAGILVDDWKISTSREGQALVAGATIQAMLEPNCRIQWKTIEGFTELDAAQIIRIAVAVRSHVQACFDRESVLLATYNAGTFDETMLTEGWP
ncbi:DUF4376 domain-containing protein [Pseudomonas rubra]|uniref:DUF4376 domain-containing protein n=1 Tax=Pseudomonas rubra TaxID=2942627 RepID=A0ABT5PEY0_9PSED|nr:DUF4376 domain-containing protein [Pseudomonas rubra]MDD1016823.1 DUF4376 domain-containing protein [Pseudomonas rubra]MDD1041462.1 DUF4376 domain-containing protein [Pseudomonas rubra]MDD1154967.1 DUF4376 domain-containing protein [Pseudomonas rubra]